jgi:hypothetical protein
MEVIEGMEVLGKKSTYLPLCRSVNLNRNFYSAFIFYI